MPHFDHITSLLASDTPATWVFCGDSITHGAVHTVGYRDYTELFDERMYELVFEMPARKEDVVINTGVSGWSTSILQPRVEERILRFKPDAVFIMLGTNDAVASFDGLDGFAQRYADIIAQIRAAGIERIVLQTAFPMPPLDPALYIGSDAFADTASLEVGIRGFAARQESIETYVETTRRVATQHGLPLIDHWPIWKNLGTLMGHYTDGGFHPNEYGHRLIAHTIFRDLGIWDAESRICRMFLP
jgi:acyl-CoA thioesterase I